MTVLTDIHLDPFFDSEYSNATFCRDPSIPIDHLTSSYEWGRYGCDCSELLVETMLDEAQKMSEDSDVIILTGDYQGHGLSVLPGEEDHYDLI